MEEEFYVVDQATDHHGFGVSAFGLFVVGVFLMAAVVFGN